MFVERFLGIVKPLLPLLIFCALVSSPSCLNSHYLAQGTVNRKKVFYNMKKKMRFHDLSEVEKKLIAAKDQMMEPTVTRLRSVHCLIREVRILRWYYRSIEMIQNDSHEIIWLSAILEEKSEGLLAPKSSFEILSQLIFILFWRLNEGSLRKNWLQLKIRNQVLLLRLNWTRKKKW